MDSDKTENGEANGGIDAQSTLAVVVDRTVAALSKFIEERGDVLMILEDSPKQSGVELGLIAQASELSAKIVFADNVGAALLIETQCTELMAPYAPTAKTDLEAALDDILDPELARLDDFELVTFNDYRLATVNGDLGEMKQLTITLDAIRDLRKRLRGCSDKIHAGYLATQSQNLRGVDGDENQNPPKPDANDASATLSDDDKAQVLPVESEASKFQSLPAPSDLISVDGLFSRLQNWIDIVLHAMGDDHVQEVIDDVEKARDIQRRASECHQLGGRDGLKNLNILALMVMGQEVATEDALLPSGPHGDEDFGDSDVMEDNPDDFNGGDSVCDMYPMIGTKARYLTSDKGDVTAHVGIVKAVMVSPTDGRLLVQLVNEAGDIHNADGFTVNYDEQDYDLFCDVMGKVEAISVEGNELVRKTIEKYNEKVGKQFERLGSAVPVDTFETKH